ncbi:MarR family transcriptional regulator [Gordonia sp. (in: high G+C Gram-positive bacteria)]|uniref:MarR family winged helix-turn-helix transcriptional regulator n=1 Tax=Gordonia sp. (in: high G+C Gram-positive bacteria) TaxID=84139 RepID=UPI00257943F7|nr:MarR family transcriptional regulator [Gordonia sp. (in: high G+C Gram-positive bacteria)]
MLSNTPSVDDPSATSGSVDATTGKLTEFLDRLACVAKAQTMDSLAAADLTFSQMRVMFALGAHGDGAESMSLNEIADHINLSLAAAGRTVDKLVGAGLVHRREDATDRRVKRVSLTAEGSDVITSHVNIHRELLRTFVAGLPEPLQVDLGAAMAAIVDNDVDYFAGLHGEEMPDAAARPFQDNTQKVTS